MATIFSSQVRSTQCLEVVGQNASQTLDSASAWLLPATESLQRTRLLAVEALITHVGDGSFTFLVGFQQKKGRYTKGQIQGFEKREGHTE